MVLTKNEGRNTNMGPARTGRLLHTSATQEECKHCRQRLIGLQDTLRDTGRQTGNIRRGLAMRRHASSCRMSMSVTPRHD